MSDTAIQLIVGLGNPGPRYAGTRHNAGFWFVDALARDAGGSFAPDAKFFGEICRVDCGGHDVRLLKPNTFMNESGRSVQAVARFFKIPATAIVVAYDEIDLPPGKVKLKKGGGHGGHNGLRDLMRHLDADFIRLRLGVGHPGHKDLVSNYVLGNPPREDEDKILAAMGRAIDVVPTLLGDGLQKATHQLHSTVPVPAGKGPDKGQSKGQNKNQNKPAGRVGGTARDGTKKADVAQSSDINSAGNNLDNSGSDSSGSSGRKKFPKKGATPARQNATMQSDSQAIKKQGGLKEQLLALLKRAKK